MDWVTEWNIEACMSYLCRLCVSFCLFSVISLCFFQKWVYKPNRKLQDDTFVCDDMMRSSAPTILSSTIMVMKINPRTIASGVAIRRRAVSQSSTKSRYHNALPWGWFNLSTEKESFTKFRSNRKIAATCLVLLKVYVNVIVSWSQ